APVVDVFRGEKLLNGGARSVRIFSIGKTAHSDDTLVIYLPAEQVLYQGDMLILPKAGTWVPPAYELTRALDKLVRDKGLVVQRIIGTHGRWGTMDDVRTALTRAPKSLSPR